MSQTKKLEQGQWVEFFSIFSNGNRGRKIAIEVEDRSAGDQPVADGSPLFAIDYDPANKGDDLVVSTGKEAVEYSHTISAPAEIWQAQDDNGEVLALEVIDHNRNRTVITFKSR